MGRLTAPGGSVPIRAVKFFLPVAAFSVLSLAACTTDANRRALYRPKQGDGYWTRTLENETYEDRKLKDERLPGAPEERPAQR